jgi:hypothetical protein
VKLEKGAMQLRDDEVLVIARIAEERRLLVIARQVDAVRAEEQLRPIGALVEMRTGARSAAVDAVELQRRRSEVRDRLRIDLTLENGRRIEGDVVIDELPEKRESGRQPAGIVGIGVRVGSRIHRSGLVAELPQPGRVGLERRKRKHPPENAVLVEMRARRVHAPQLGAAVMSHLRGSVVRGTRILVSRGRGEYCRRRLGQVFLHSPSLWFTKKECRRRRFPYVRRCKFMASAQNVPRYSPPSI